MPDQVLRHDISDEELTMLVDPRRDPLSEQKWGFIGLFGGSLLPAVAALINFFVRNQEVSILDLVAIVCFFVGGALAIYIHSMNKRLAIKPTDLAEKIRARSGKRVHSHAEQ